MPKRKPTPQPPDVNCSRGAPMGRHSYGPVPDDPKSIQLVKVDLNTGGYDKGGAYWGTGEPIYWAFSVDDSSYCQYVRAKDRLAAAVALDLPVEVVRNPPTALARRASDAAQSPRATEALKQLVADAKDLGYLS